MKKNPAAANYFIHDRVRGFKITLNEFVCFNTPSFKKLPVFPQAKNDN